MRTEIKIVRCGITDRDIQKWVEECEKQVRAWKNLKYHCKNEETGADCLILYNK